MAKRKKKRAKQLNRPTPKPKTYYFGYYALAFVDILNQKSELRKIKKLPTNEEEKSEFISQVKNTFGVVQLFRTSFDSFFQSFLKNRPLQASGLSREQIDSMNRFRNPEVRKQLFSDSIIYYAPLEDTSKRFAITNVQALLAGCAASILSTLSIGLACRGGIEAGIAGDVFANEIYGPALYQAYRLESEVAKYPRILVGSELRSYIDFESRISVRNIEDEVRRSMAEKCKDWLYTDDDGETILDYMGPAAKEMWGNRRELIENSLVFVEKERKRFQDEKDEKLAERYSRLQNYLIKRFDELWK